MWIWKVVFCSAPIVWGCKGWCLAYQHTLFALGQASFELPWSAYPGRFSERDYSHPEVFQLGPRKAVQFSPCAPEVKVLSIFFVVNISTSVYTGVVSYISLPQAFLVPKPAELVRCFGDFWEVRELQIELFCILKLVRQYHRKLKNLQRGYFYWTWYIANQNVAADFHLHQQTPFCIKRCLFCYFNPRLFRCIRIAFSTHLAA